MEMKIRVVMAVIIVFLVIAIIPISKGGEIRSTKNETESSIKVIVNLVLPENRERGITSETGTISLIVSGSLSNNLGSLGIPLNQYAVPPLDEPIREDEKVKYKTKLFAEFDEDLDQGTPTIHQDNVGENYCFYAFHKPYPTLPGSWWDDLGCDSLTLRIVLPEGYELRRDVENTVSNPEHGYVWWESDEEENEYLRRGEEYSVFTTGTHLETGFENGRQYVEAGWTLGEFNKYSTPYYIEFHYRLPFYSLDLETLPSGGGSVSLEPEGGTYEVGTGVALTADPARGYEFDHWSGDASGTDNQITVEMDSDKNLTAHFGKTEEEFPLLWIGIGIGILIFLIITIIYWKRSRE